MVTTLPILGVDIDQEYIVVHLLRSGLKARFHKFKNSTTGFAQLVEWLLGLEVQKILVCMEATGRYGEGLAKYLYDLGHEVVVVNPAFISSHKKALNRHNKTDPTDAEAIADYARCFVDKLRLWQPLSPLQGHLRDVIGQICMLKKSMTMFSNRGGSGLEDGDVCQSIQRTLRHLSVELAEMEKIRDELFNSLPKLQEVREIIDEVPGIGPEISSVLAAKVNFANFKTGRELACFLGLGSSEWKSGKQRKRGKQTKAGDSDLRALIRQGALSATYRSPFYGPFVKRLRERGLKNQQIVTAVARKMILIAHALVRNKSSFDRRYQHPLLMPQAS